MLLAVAGATAALSVAVAPSAFATFLPTTTTVTANPANSTAGTSVTLTATVTVGGLSLGTQPSGSVSFSASNGSASTPLGSATLGSCSGSSCKATLVTTAIPVGSTSVTASYPGAGLTAPSSGSTAVTVTQPPPPPVPEPTGSSTSVTCPAGVPCETGYVNTTASALDVASDPSTGQQTVSAMLESGKNLHCHQNTDPQVGHLGTFDTTATDSKKIIHYRGKKNASAQMLANYNLHPDYVGCFGSPTVFQGYVAGVYKDAEVVNEQGVLLYEAQVANCAVHPALPCFTLSIVGGNTQYDIQAPSGDPKIIG